MKIEIGFDGGGYVSSFLDNYGKEAELTDYETRAVDIIRGFLTDGNTFRCERHTPAYITLVVGNTGDFCRIKTSERTTWFSVDMWGAPKELQDDPRLAEVKNKNQRHWKVPLNDINDIQNYADFILSAYERNKARDETQK